MFSYSSLFVLATALLGTVSASPIAKRMSTELIIGDIALIQNAMSTAVIDLARAQVLQTNDSTEAVLIDVRTIIDSIDTAVTDLNVGQGVLDNTTASTLAEVYTDGLSPQFKTLVDLLNEQGPEDVSSDMMEGYRGLTESMVSALPEVYIEVVVTTYATIVQEIIVN